MKLGKRFVLSGSAFFADKIQERKEKKEAAYIDDPIRDRKNYLKKLKKLGYSTAPLFVLAAKNESEATDILVRTYRLRAFLIGETLENEQGMFFITNELPKDSRLFTFALKDAKSDDIFALHVPSAVANYYYFETDYVKRLEEMEE